MLCLDCKQVQFQNVELFFLLTYFTFIIYSQLLKHILFKIKKQRTQTLAVAL